MASTAFRQTHRPHPHLYEINTWAWLAELSDHLGKKLRLGDVPEQEWDRLQAKGFDFIWLMGLWERSPESRRLARTAPELLAAYDRALPGWGPDDVVGSPYAVRAYRPDPELATWAHVDAVRNKLHQRGMGLVLDFVPNHTARDHDWVRTQPDWYILGTDVLAAQRPAEFFTIEHDGRAVHVAHGRDPYFPPWTDTAQLNHFNPELRRALLNELHIIAQHCDGVRCDMAMLVLNDIFDKTWSEFLAQWPEPEQEFWTEAVSALPEFLWLGEVYWDREWEMQQLGFHYTYDKRLYDRLRAGSAAEVVAHLSAGWDFQRKLVRFLENHDEPRSPVAFGKTRLPGVATLLATLPGMRFYHQGQLEGRTRHLPVQLRRAADETPDRLLCRWYERLLELTRDEVFHTGEWRLLPVEPAGDDTSRHLIAYQWRRNSTWAIVVVNLGREPAQGNVVLNDELEENGAPGYVLIDRLHGQAYERPAEELRLEGLYVSLDPYWAHLFTVTPVRKRQGQAGFAQDSLKGGRHG